jgi:hypothetical protein
LYSIRAILRWQHYGKHRECLFQVQYKHATLASGGSVAVSGGNRSTFTLDLSETIDCLILR